MPILISNINDFLNLKGEILGTSQWIVITQEMVNQFADATLDKQWIHIDEKRAANGPYGTTIVHGYLTLSLIPFFLENIFHVDNVKMLVNYSIEKMIYRGIVPVGSKVRMTATLKSAKDLGDICQTKIECKFEREGDNTPILEGSIIFLYYF